VGGIERVLLSVRCNVAFVRHLEGIEKKRGGKTSFLSQQRKKVHVPPANMSANVKVLHFVGEGKRSSRRWKGGERLAYCRGRRGKDHPMESERELPDKLRFFFREEGSTGEEGEDPSFSLEGGGEERLRGRGTRGI